MKEVANIRAVVERSRKETEKENLRAGAESEGSPRLPDKTVKDIFKMDSQ